jgi:hypothetical protein
MVMDNRRKSSLAERRAFIEAAQATGALHNGNGVTDYDASSSVPWSIANNSYDSDSID